MPYSQLVFPRSDKQGSQRLRLLRAIWHDTRALLSEFRRPLLAIFFSIFVGGWLYSRLTIAAGYDPIAAWDVPYVMLTMMVMENTLGYLPTEWYLISFWYLQPAIAVYIIGRGAVDFLRLFFNRNERRSAWELAVAKTYRHHVVLIGVGHVGLRVARTLSNMGFEIVAIDDDLDPEADEEISELNIPLIPGDARLSGTLHSARVEHARAIVVCTSDDHVNLEITMRARDLNHDVRIVTRMWDNRFAEQMKRFLNVEVMSASDLAAPAFAGSAVGIEITQTVKVGGHDYSMIKLTVEPGSFMDGKKIDFLQDEENLDIVLHGVSGSEPVVHPPGEVRVRAHDTLVLFARHSKIIDVVARNRPAALRQ